MTILADYIQRAAKALLSVFYPEKCLCCGSMLADSEHYLCANCVGHVHKTDMHMHAFNQAETRFDPNLHILRAASYGWYQKDSELRDMIHLAKYAARPEILYQMARQAATEWKASGFFDDVDIIVPVPMHKDKLRQRGYNQTDYIAHGLADVLCLPVCEDVLLRIRNDESQTMQLTEQRLNNVKGAFALNPKHQLSNKTILLVDDVLTTGATLSDCTRQLKKAKNTQIIIFTLAVTPA